MQCITLFILLLLLLLMQDEDKGIQDNLFSKIFENFCYSYYYFRHYCY